MAEMDNMCVRTVSYNVIVNDALVGPVVPGRDLRQGGPLSPYLFILYAEGLSSLLAFKNRRGRLHGCKVSRRAPITSFFFFFAYEISYFVVQLGRRVRFLKEIWITMNEHQDKPSIMQSPKFSIVQMCRMSLGKKLILFWVYLIH